MERMESLGSIISVLLSYPGIRFKPTDEELVHYLKQKANLKDFHFSIIAEVNLYDYAPWDLPSMALYGEREWYFFSPRDRKYPRGERPNRAAKNGYWKATGTDKAVTSDGGHRKVGVKKSLVFYHGRAPAGERTNWIMHEYRLAEGVSPAAHRHQKGSLRLDDWVLCRIYEKPLRQRAGQDYNSVEEVLTSLPELDDPRFYHNSEAGSEFVTDQDALVENSSEHACLSATMDSLHWTMMTSSWPLQQFMGECMASTSRHTPNQVRFMPALAPGISSSQRANMPRMADHPPPPPHETIHYNPPTLEYNERYNPNPMPASRSSTFQSSPFTTQFEEAEESMFLLNATFDLQADPPPLSSFPAPGSTDNSVLHPGLRVDFDNNESSPTDTF